jgi:PAS domain S-box-containing protein
MVADASPVSPSSDELLRVIVESSTGFAIFSMDPSGTVIAWNRGAERLLGYADEEIIGRDGDVIFTPEDRALGVPDRERQVATADGRAEDERWHMRKDGSRFWGSGLLMPLRGVNGYVKILRDNTHRHELEESVRASEARFRLLATNIPQLVFRTRGNGDRTWGSPQWEMFTGLADTDSRGLGWVDAVHPEDRERTVLGWRDATVRGEYLMEHRIRRQADGEYRWHQTQARPVKGGDPETAEWVGTSTDIHELRRLQGRQQLLLAELQHRSRNVIAMVQAMARQTIRNSTSLEMFQEEFEGRLRALSRVQSLLAQTNYERLQLRDIVEAELFARGDFSDRASIDGPPVRLGPSAAQSLALALHELATNAVKYGALHQPNGRLNITWQTQREEYGEVIVLEWRERGVAMTGSGRRRRRGYGSELIERALPYQLGARTNLEFGRDGVHCVIAVPVAPPGDLA